jgi:hypothetical protein
MMAQLVKFPGIKKTIGGVEYVVPPVSLRTLQQLQSELEKFDSAGAQLNPEAVSTAITVIHSALARNYPSMTIDEVSDLIDVGNMMELFEVVMDVSGMRRKELEAESAGEEKPRKP